DSYCRRRDLVSDRSAQSEKHRSVKRFIANLRFPISNLKPYVVLLVVALMQASCLSRRRTIPPGQQLLPAQSMGRAELLRRLEDRSKAIRTLTASAALDASHGGIDRGEI